MLSLGVLLMLSSTWSATVPPKVFIVNGKDVPSISTYPWVVSIHNATKGLKSHSFCGGALIDSTTVVTAAHCSTGDDDITALDPSELLVASHRFNQSADVKSEHPAVFNVTSVHIHPLFNQTDDEVNSNIFYDIAVWKVQLVSGKPCNSDIRLDSGKYSKPGKLLTVVGWGDTIFNATEQSSTLKETKVPVTSDKLCFTGYPKLKDNPTAFCAGYEDGRTDACSGDSGGPIFVKENNVVTLTGVVSTGFECARAGKPGIYTRISYVRDWIRDIQINGY